MKAHIIVEMHMTGGCHLPPYVRGRTAFLRIDTKTFPKYNIKTLQKNTIKTLPANAINVFIVAFEWQQRNVITLHKLKKKLFGLSGALLQCPKAYVRKFGPKFPDPRLDQLFPQAKKCASNWRKVFISLKVADNLD